MKHVLLKLGFLMVGLSLISGIAEARGGEGGGGRGGGESAHSSGGTGRGGNVGDSHPGGGFSGERGNHQERGPEMHCRGTYYGSAFYSCGG
ncbi:hypothetical protein [Microvirga puerhi]|uniref:Uncharacterized protein n=1 Tax=Microvirga puerhi TaxID=2876078 RepID=A0ABS7VPH7_9HYPH|nr:hypothetical protein [Microvirga puerhi]MBZ6077005.1 hypothetical protein [Microvirga puerhi]